MDDVIDEKISNLHLSDKTGTSNKMPGSPGEEAHVMFNELIMRGKKFVGEGNIEKAVKCNKKALQICYSEKLARKIKKMEDYLAAHAEESEDEEDNGMIHLGKGFYLYKELYNNLYAHQQQGVLWMWSLYRRKKGGILGDDMGLGKTIQVIGFLSGMFDMQKIQSVLIVLPVAVMVNWEKEFQKWAPGLKVVAYYGNSKREKERALARVQKRGGICLTTYGLVVTSWEQMGKKEGREFTWDYIILDEGHKIKNPTKTSKGVHAIPARHRIILTGTPVQNNLKELWSLFDFVHQGSLLGTQRTFKMEFENPITRAREKDATIGEKKLGLEMAESLKQMIAPYFLRRTKGEVKGQEKEEKENKKSGDVQLTHAVMPTMTRKNDLIVWTFLKETQLNIYQDFLSLDSVKELLMTTKSPLVALNVLKKICDHPRLLSTRACAQLGIEGDEGLDDDILKTEAGNMSAVTRIQHVADEILIKESGKLVFLVQLLDRLKAEGHRCLVFSQSRKMLDIMQKVIGNRGHKIMRLDGTISSVQEREQRIQKFQTDPSYSVFLLTTQVGGVGLTLTAADRVVIFDPSWNPATDAQAVDRAFRIGQDKNVVIYRLITCGTVEEKIYRRQIFKDSITRQTTGNSKNPYRYFSKYELKELFTLDDPQSSTTQQQLESMHSGQRLTDPSLDEHIAYLYSLEMFGLSDHDLMFSQGNEAGDHQDMEPGEDEPQSGLPENDYILHRVQKAREIIQMESSQSNTLEERLGKGSQQGSVGALIGRNQFQNWDFPKREEDVKEEEDEGELSDDNGVDEDLTHGSSPARVKTEPNTIDLTTPVVTNVKRDPDVQILDTPRLKHEPMEDDAHVTTPVKTPVNVKYERDTDHDIMEIGTPTRTPLRLEDLNTSRNVNSPSKRRSVSRGLTPRKDDIGTPKTPARGIHVVTEEMFISPNASAPLVQICKTSKPNLSTGSIGSVSDFRPKFHSTIFGAADTPELDNQTTSSIGSRSSNESSSHNQSVFVQDSPQERGLSLRQPLRTIVQDSPNLNISETNKRKKSSEGRNSVEADDELMGEDEDQRNTTNDAVIIDESLIESDNEEKENMEPANISARDMRAILEKSLSHKNDDILNESHHSPIRDRHDISHRVDNSFSDDDDDDDNYELSYDGNDQENDEIEQDDIGDEIEQSYVDNGNDEMDGHTNHHYNDEVQNNDEDDDHRDIGDNDEGDDDYEEDESEEEEAVDEFAMLPEEEQLQYNDLIEKGREYCQNKNYETGLVCVLQALEIYADTELQATAISIQKKIARRQKRAGMESQQGTV